MLDLIVHGLARLAVPLFLLGMAGSLVLILVSVVEDLKDLFGGN